MLMMNFSIASTLGKIPALVIEAYSALQVLNWSGQGKVWIFRFIPYHYWRISKKEGVPLNKEQILLTKSNQPFRKTG